MFRQPVFNDKMLRAEIWESLCWTISVILKSFPVLEKMVSPDGTML